jgi:predicted dehydrogenase
VKVKIAVVGCGMIAENSYVPRIVKNPEAELVAVCARSEESGALMRRRFGIARVYSDLDRMLAEEPLDLVINLTPNQAHYTINLKVLEARKHLYSEKTLALTVERARTSKVQRRG